MAAVDSFHLLYKEIYREIARSCDCYVEALAVVGALYTASRAVRLMRDCYSLVRLHFIPRLVSRGGLAHRYGQWALVCGASEAVTRAYAEELASQGICIILITPDLSSVSEIAKTISETYGVEAIVIQADFSLGHAACKPVEDIIRDKNVGFVINGLEVSDLDSSQSFADISEGRLWNALNRNIMAASLLTQLALPGMLERGGGAVVNISSSRCSRPSQTGACFFAATAYLDTFSQALHHEYGQHGIFVQSLVPYDVARSSASEGGGWLVPRPQVYARHALSTLGITHRTTGYWPHMLQAGMLQCLPDWLWVLGARLLPRPA